MGAMEYFNIGQQMAGTNSLGDAIRGVLTMHNDLTKAAGGEMFKSAQPLARAQVAETQAKTGYYNEQASSLARGDYSDWYKNGKVVPEGTPGAKLITFQGKTGKATEFPGQDNSSRDMTREKAVTMATSEADNNPQTATPGPRRDKFINDRTTQLEGILGGGAITTQTPPPPKPGFLNQIFNGPGQAIGNQMPVPQNMTPYAANKAGMPQYAAPVQPPANNVTGSAQPTVFNTTYDADNSGLPSGTIVMVGGRRYKI